MDRRDFGLVTIALLVSACHAPDQKSAARTAHSDLVFLTREGCVNTPDMALNLEGALRALGVPSDYEVIDLGTLPATDARIGYPTPTVLYNGRDLFGLPVPTPPFPEPT